VRLKRGTIPSAIVMIIIIADGSDTIISMITIIVSTSSPAPQ
jgi:hypothetical protein